MSAVLREGKEFLYLPSSSPASMNIMVSTAVCKCGGGGARHITEWGVGCGQARQQPCFTLPGPFPVSQPPDTMFWNVKAFLLLKRGERRRNVPVL